MSRITDATEEIVKGGEEFDDAMDAIDAEEMLETLRGFARKLRETAAGLDLWVRHGQGDRAHPDRVHPTHAANRLRKMARGIDGGK